MPSVVLAPPKVQFEGEFTAYDLLYTFPGLASGFDVTLFFDDDHDLMYIMRPQFGNDDVIIVDLKTGNTVYSQLGIGDVTPGYQPNITAPQASMTGKYAVFVDLTVSPAQLVVLKNGMELTRLDFTAGPTPRNTSFISPKAKYVAVAIQNSTIYVWKGR